MHITGQHCISAELQDVQKSLSSLAAHSNNPFSRPTVCFLVSRPLLNDTREKRALLQRSQVSKSSAEKLGCVHRLGTQLGFTIQNNAQYDALSYITQQYDN